ncbi:hypothetical protein O4H66_17375 [Comamonadaceae bacterium G21597-S1]|nr:hypothetical protein [Comamonadaceae bacterium G21597-S1]
MTARAIAVALVLLVLLPGCATTPAQLQPVHVAVPVPCQAVVPDRPVMPTESLQLGVTLFGFVTAAQAEIERREGYEQRLLAALLGCVTPAPPR